ncbi:Alkaline phosphatase D precursor [Planctomycetes bacterium Pan216]|uniref:Alkaline phosphatase D n=1 Tax=Kolteria novifilia TaxID=2527975 RepID=A0A518AX72_9BACT|nr:Alkaline phosphatase D precursor [Planctomycetes bacterium Pan216]
MKRRPFLLALGTALTSVRQLWAMAVAPSDKVTLGEAHRGTLEIDTRLLDSYGKPPEHLRQFYLDARRAFAANAQSTFTDSAIVDAAKRHGLTLMGGPMLGDLRDDGVTLWLRPATETPMSIAVGDKSYAVPSARPGSVVRVQVDGLSPKTRYDYALHADGKTVGQGEFTTAPSEGDRGSFRLAFGSCCHKIGVHNPNLFREIRKRQPHAMLLLGDIAADDRNNEVNMHRADYQLRDVSGPWRELAGNIPLFAAWDDHDYFDNDLSGIPKKFTAKDVGNVREVWHENWNNPPADSVREGIYFSTRMGPVEVIMLDTRSCRDGKRRGKYGSYLGERQQEWLKETLRNSTAPFKVISSGTMWSDYVSKAKDSWGSWDTEAREELFSLIEEEGIGGVLLISGDRHGARGFRIPQPSGYNFYEFEPATLGGVSGPAGLVKNCPEQLFGYSGRDRQGNDLVAFGEFTFDTSKEKPTVTFRLIDQHGTIKEEHELSLAQLTPGGSSAT